MKLIVSAALFAAATAAWASSPTVQPVEELGWMTGAWNETHADGTVIREAWLSPKGGAMAGVGQTNAPGKPPSIEAMRITTSPSGPVLTAFVSGQKPTVFVRLPSPPGEAVFENKAHDFPQRVIYRRCGADLCAAIEGEIDGKPQGRQWRYSRDR